MLSLESLRISITAGESLPLELVRRHYELLPHATLYNEYGPTEATVWCSVYQTTREETAAHVPIGKPIAHMQLYVLDASLQLMPIGVPGELYIAGECPGPRLCQPAAIDPRAVSCESLRARHQIVSDR